ncbi:MAG: DUF6263 family protein [Planctomycetaceae bacterium]
MITTKSLTAACLLFAGFLIGCDHSDSDASTSADADSALLDELLGSPDTASESGSETAGKPNPATPVTLTARGERLELRLQPGDRFPLIKTIEQTLIQKSEAYPAMARTRLELSMAIDVREVRPDAILMSVSYSRIGYSHDINGQRIVFDSDTHQGRVPDDVIPYAGMVGNGFSFWLGRDNRIRELVDYDAFLERCVRHVPIERRQSLLAEISTRFGDDGVANFVDDTIGLLPYNTDVDADSATRVVTGDVWTRERRLMQPVPIYLTSTYRLVSLDDDTAEIDITGRIASGETYRDVNSQQKSGVRILGGQSIGSCIVDRATGLPLELNRTRFLNMEVTTEDNERVTQDKQIVTTIRAFPQARGPVVQNAQPADSRQMSGSQPATPGQPISSVRLGTEIQPVSAADVSGQSQNATAIPTTSDGTAQAVYPQ